MSKPKKPKPLTDQEIVDQTNGLARQFYAGHGYQVEAGYRFDEATHPQERGMWHLACLAQEYLCGTDPEDSLAAIEDDTEAP